MKSILLKVTLASFFSFLIVSASSQTASISGKVLSAGKPVESASIKLSNISAGTITDTSGLFSIKNLSAGKYVIHISSIGYADQTKQLLIKEGEIKEVDIELFSLQSNLEEVVVTGTLKEVKRIESPVPVEVYTPAFFKKNPTPNIFDALQNVNGVRPQLNCNVCNTGDIHINGLEGPYTMVLIDGMPIVSSLSTVYGLSGIPNSLVERIEIVKGPASSLYGSEAVGGLINIITKKPANAPALSLDLFATSWKEFNADLGFKFKAGNKATVLTGINYFNYGNIIDNNGDNFTDVTLQNRVSIFQKWNFERKNNRLLSVAARYFNEDRWGGDVRYTKAFRGGDSLYGESIYTKRMGVYW
ncbi:MAG: TonB-dependent receptor plug domain-containing protein [Chitinophagaceae bacterium]